MKEQTLTAEEFLKEQELIQKGFSKFIIEHPKLGKVDLSEFMEQYTQAKVLEALEKEVVKARVSKDISIKERVLKHIVSEEVLDKYIFDAQQYYETEVKPKYQNKDKSKEK